MSIEGVATTGSPEVRVSTSSGSVIVIGEPREGVAAEGGIVEIDGTTVKVVGRNKSSSLTIRCPETHDVVVGTRSGSLEVRGRVGAVRFTTQSGGLRAKHVAAAEIRVMSGSIDIERCDGECRLKTISGSVRVGSAASAHVAVGSGKINLDDVAGPVRAKAVSGSVDIGAGGGGRVEAETISGSITITVPAGSRPHVRAKSLSKSTDIGVPAGDDFEIACKTLSGGITVRSR
jgi:DUF4097 and DUF4098 domain-containing protein YvlB